MIIWTGHLIIPVLWITQGFTPCRTYIIETLKRLSYRGGTNSQDSQECSSAQWSEATFLWISQILLDYRLWHYHANNIWYCDDLFSWHFYWFLPKGESWITWGLVIKSRKWSTWVWDTAILVWEDCIDGASTHWFTWDICLPQKASCFILKTENQKCNTKVII